jgi:hypothetical protein
VARFIRARKSAQRPRASSISRWGTPAGVLAEHVEQDDEVGRAAVEDPVELGAEVAAQLAELALDLRAVRERKVGLVRAQQVEALDLLVEHRLAARIEALDEVVDGLAPVRGAVVDRLEALLTAH